MELRVTPALAVAGSLSVILLVWIGIDVVSGDLAPNVLVNLVIVAAVGAWVYYLSNMRAEQRREQARQAEQEQDEREIAEMIKHYRSE